METVTSFSGNLVTKSGYTLEGGFTLSITETGLQLSLGEDYKASTTLPGLYVYLSNNKNTTSQAYEIGPVKVFTGSHSYDLPSSIGLMDYQYILYWCKPFNVKVRRSKNLRLMKISTFILLCIFSFSFVHGQWIKEKGSGYSKISGWSLLADEHFTDQGKIDPNATRGLFISSIYLQYGLSKNINFIAYLPLWV
ncbi:MAG: DM13 domain-containing protein [Bacteroidetes bacterium]|nr:DM13 domain-containing protein [Bacteroidota bacterium]